MEVEGVPHPLWFFKDSLLVCNGFSLWSGAENLSLFKRPVLPAETGGKASNRRNESVNETCRR